MLGNPTSQQRQEVGTQEARKITRAEREARRDVESEGNSASNTQTGRVSPAGTPSDISVQKSTVVRTAEIQHRALSLSGLW